MKRQFITLVLLLCSLLTFAQFTGTVSDLQGVKYTANKYESTCYVSGHEDNYSTTIVIPEEYEGRSVTGIGYRAFDSCSGLTSITLPDGMTSIGDYAFSGCSGLASVTIPYGVTSIGSSAFQGCSSLLSIDLPSSISFIGQKAFYGCDNLTKVKVGMITPLAIAENVFTNLNNATLYVPSSCNSIPEGDDMTKYMKNPNFSEGEKGWTGWRTVWQVKWPDESDPGRQMPKVNEKCAEAFSAPNFDLYQEVEGLPLGIYEVSVQGFFRFGRGNDAWTEWNKQGEERADYVTVDDPAKGSPVFFYVNEKATPFKNIFEEGGRPGDSPLFDDLETAKEEQTPLKRYSYDYANVEITTWEDVSEIHAVENCLRVDGNDGYLFFPDGMKSAHNYFNSGDYKQSISCAVARQGDKLRIGVRGHTDVGVASDNLDSWAIFDNFKLIYKGTFKAAYQAADVWKDFGTILEVDMPQDNVEVTDVSAIDNVIYMEPFEVLRGTEVTVPLKMKNTAGVRGFQFDMYLPLGVTVKKDGNNCFICSLNDDRKPSGSAHTLTVNEQQDGAIRFLCGSQYDETFTGTEGEILTVQLCVDEKMLAGLYPIILKNVKLTETNINNFYLTETVQTALTVIPYIPGDLSGDGVIDVSDYIGVANYILGTPQTGITAAAADVNKDNLVDVSDYIGVANLILYNNIYGQTANASRRWQKRANTDVSALNNVVYITPFETTSNSETQVSVKMKNTVGIRGFQFDLYLPEGITAKKDGNNRIVCSLNNGRKPSGDQHTLTMSEQPDGAIRFLCGSQYDETFTGTDGEIATLTISVAADVEADNYPIYLRNMKLTETDINNYYTTDEIETSVTVTGPADGRVVLDESSTTAPEAANGVDVRVKRTINANEWSTICLPFAMSATQVKAAFGNDVQLGDFTGYVFNETQETITLNFSTVTAIEANHPYVIKVTSAISEFTVDNVDIAPVEEPMVNNGTSRRPKAIVGTYVANTTIGNGCLFLSNNKFLYSLGTTKMKAFRAYFDFIDLLPDFEENYAETRIQMAFDDETANVVELKDGRMEELKSCYNLKGQRVEKPLKKGLYIRNGKKVIIK